MSEIKHTPGPWDAQLTDTPYCCDIPVVVAGSGFTVAEVMNLDSFGACLDDEVTDHEIDEMEKSARATATLIAAAPDLLAACKLALEKCNFAVGSMKAKQALQDAIAKAENQSEILK